MRLVDLTALTSSREAMVSPGSADVERAESVETDLVPASELGKG